MSLIQIRSLTKTIPLVDADPLHILRGIDLEVAAGDHVSIVGRSGSGKSTLLNMLGMLDRPSSGDYAFDGASVTRARPGQLNVLRRKNIGFVFQQFNLLGGRTATENVVMPLLYRGAKNFWRRTELAHEMLDRVGLGHRFEHTPESLSGGEQQRVAIARALVSKPRLILADEPTGALDVDTGRQVIALLQEVAAETGSALIVITHDPAIAAIANRVEYLAEGLLFASEPDEATVRARRAEADAATGVEPLAELSRAPKHAAPPQGQAEAVESDDAASSFFEETFGESR